MTVLGPGHPQEPPGRALGEVEPLGREQGIRTRTRSPGSSSSSAALGPATSFPARSARRTAATIAFTARTVRPRTVSRQAASVSGVARRAASPATVQESSPATTARSGGRAARGSAWGGLLGTVEVTRSKVGKQITNVNTSLSFLFGLPRRAPS